MNMMRSFWSSKVWCKEVGGKDFFLLGLNIALREDIVEDG